MKNSKTVRIDKGLYEVTTENGLFTLICWKSYFGDGGPEWHVHYGNSEEALSESDTWAACLDTKKEAIEWILE